jgi:hypothetical protein
MSNLVEDVKNGKFNSKEYSLEDGSGAKAVEFIPSSAVTSNERLTVNGLDDLKVPLHLLILTK